MNTSSQRPRISSTAAFILFLFLFKIDSQGLAVETVTCRVWLFHGIKIQAGGIPGDVEILTHPRLTALKALAGGSENEFADALVEALLDISDLKRLDDLFLFKETLDKGRQSISSAVIKRQLAFRVDLDRIKFSPPQFVLQAAISRSREGAIRNYADDKRSAREAYLASQDDSRMVKIVDLELSLEIGNPVVVSAPREDGAYFMVVLLTPAEHATDVSPSKIVRQLKAAELVGPPKPITKVLPVYPEELRKRGVEGEVGIRVTIDDHGRVENVVVRKPLHPYLDYLTVQAFLAWTYDPVLRNGQPIRATFDYGVRFDPSLYHEEALLSDTASAPSDQSGQSELRRIVAGCVEYCRKLAEKRLFFTCEESIREVRYHLKEAVSNSDLSSYFDVSSGQLSENISITVGQPVQIMDPSRTEVNRYDSDYQLIRKDGEVEERRIVLRQNGQKPSNWTKLLVEKRFSAVNPILHLLKIFDRDRQGLFYYELLGEAEVRGKKTFVIAAVPRLGNEGEVRWARIWAEKASFRILKIEIRGVPLDGYDDVVKESTLLNFLPFFLTTHEFVTEKNDLLFPESTTVLVGYPSPRRPILKYRATLAYKKYKFFSVETDHEIRKK